MTMNNDNRIQKKIKNTSQNKEERNNYPLTTVRNHAMDIIVANSNNYVIRGIQGDSGARHTTNNNNNVFYL